MLPPLTFRTRRPGYSHSPIINVPKCPPQPFKCTRRTALHRTTHTQQCTELSCSLSTLTTGQAMKESHAPPEINKGHPSLPKQKYKTAARTQSQSTTPPRSMQPPQGVHKPPLAHAHGTTSCPPHRPLQRSTRHCSPSRSTAAAAAPRRRRRRPSCLRRRCPPCNNFAAAGAHEP